MRMPRDSRTSPAPNAKGSAPILGALFGILPKSRSLPSEARDSPPPTRTPARISRRAAFTLVELLVSMAILSLISVLALQIVSTVSDQYKRTRGSIESFNGARLAFERITRQLSQATLATYYGYLDTDNDGTPEAYQRTSDLHFISGPADVVLPAGAAGTPVTNTLFFQAPLGYNPGGGTEQLRQLMNSVGYYVAFGADNDPKLSILPDVTGFNPPQPSHRFRLFEVREKSSELSVYESKTGTDWIGTALTETKSSQLLAENIIALAVLPKLPPDDDVSGVGLAQNFRYDSRDDRLVSVRPSIGDVREASTLNQLPPLVEVVLVALDPLSAQRLADKNGSSMPNLQLSSLFRDPAQLEADIETLTDKLIAERADFRVFRTTVGMRGAKWSLENAP